MSDSDPAERLLQLKWRLISCCMHVVTHVKFAILGRGLEDVVCDAWTLACITGHVVVRDVHCAYGAATS